MSSASGSARVPSSVIVVPLTVTRPCWISVSAVRREAMPAADKIFCRRSAMALVDFFFDFFVVDFFFVDSFCVDCFLLPDRRGGAAIGARFGVERQRRGGDGGLRQTAGEIEAKRVGEL